MEIVPFWRRSRLIAAAAALGLAAALTACGEQDGGEPADNPGAQNPPAGESPAIEEEDDITLEVMTPAEGETVTVPFEVSVNSNQQLGAIPDELHHLHIWFGDTSGEPLIIESDTTMIEDAPNGETTMIVQVHTFEHTPASDQVDVPLVVQGGSGEPSDPGPPDY